MVPRRRVRWAAVLAAGVVAGCGSAIPDGAAARAEDSESAVGAPISLVGCVQSARGADQFTLTTIQLDSTPGGPGNPGGARTGITEWSWVRLDARGHDLGRHLGERVRVDGVIAASGRNTIGTAGTWGYELPSGDKSQAASDEHYAEKQKLEMGRIARQSLANGTAAEIRVRQVHPTGDRCAGALAPERR